MVDLIKSLFTLGGLFFLGWFARTAYFWWIAEEMVINAQSITALATIVYAVFTFLMFWNIKSSSEAQIRPLLITNLNEKMDLEISNKIKQNEAKNLKIRIRAIPLNKNGLDSKSKIFIQKYLLRPQWNALWDYFKSHKKNFEVLDGSKKISLSKYVSDIIKMDGNIETSYSWNFGDKKETREEISFKLLIYLSYESLLEVKYELTEAYLVKVTSSGTKIIKINDYH